MSRAAVIDALRSYLERRDETDEVDLDEYRAPKSGKSWTRVEYNAQADELIKFVKDIKAEADDFVADIRFIFGITNGEIG